MLPYSLLLSGLYYTSVLAAVVFAILAVEAKDLLHATYLLGGESICLAVVYFVLHAPDIAITQASVGAALCTALFIFVISKTGREE